MVWYKRAIMFTNVFNPFSIELKNYLYENRVIEDASIEEIERFDDSEIKRIENTNCGALIELAIYLGFDNEKEDGGLSCLKKMLNGIENQIVLEYVKDSKVTDEETIKFLDSKFASENFAIDKKYLENAGINKCIIICTHLQESSKIDVGEELEYKKVAK